MKERSLRYEEKFRKYLFKGCIERYKEICKIIYEGEWSEIQTFCLNCGGYVNETEW